MIESNLEQLRQAAPRGTREAVLLGVGLVDGYAEYDSPVGPVIVAFNPVGVSAVDLAEGDPEERFAKRFGRTLIHARPPSSWDRLIGKAIAAGTPGDLPLDLRSMSGFGKTVLSATARIPRGQVRSYGWLAKEVGKPGAVRAVGSTMARNPVPLVVPCHRVVRSDGRIGEYSLGGPRQKWQLLRLEGSEPDQLESLARRGIRYLGSDTTHIVCLPTCAHARRITDRHRVEFHSLTEAVDAGYRTCEICRP